MPKLLYGGDSSASGSLGAGKDDSKNAAVLEELSHMSTTPGGSGGSLVLSLQVGAEPGSPGSPKSNRSRNTDDEEDEDEDSPRISAAEIRRKKALQKGPKDGLRLDAEWEAVCRQAVAAQRGALSSAAMYSPKSLGGHAANGSEAVTTTNPSRLQGYLYGDGAVYSQYDLNQASYTGGSLPEGWLAIRSRSTGRMYFANKETGETQWEPPLYPLSPEFSLEHSPQTGAVFYENRRTGQCQWERPVCELFLNLKASLGSDLEALRVWRERTPGGAKADPGFAGLDQVAAAAVPALPALLPPPEHAALPAPEQAALPW